MSLAFLSSSLEPGIMATPTKIGSPKVVIWGGTRGTLVSEDYMDGAAPSESPLADSLPAGSHTSPLSQALASERAERSEEGRKALLQRRGTGTQRKGALGANRRKNAKQREAAKAPLAGRLGEWGLWVSGSF